MDIPTILFRNPYDYTKVKKLMENKEQYIIVKFDSVSVHNLNVQGMMNVIQDYLHIYGYRVKEYGQENASKDDERDVKGYLYERVGE
ncbi:hypothetical protein [Staphylococcus phage HMGUsa2]|nr:hypothetical protein [Staphylococcus phage HMGUsa2]